MAKAEESVYLLLVVINKLAVVSNNEYSGVIFLEGRNKNKERALILFFHLRTRGGFALR